eukprot:4678860-Lingulodinium_polyedra.AAC.1
MCIRDRAAAELRGNTGPDAASVVTAATVKDYFQKLPGSVAEHPEGQQIIQQVMAMLEKLDAVAKQVGSEASRPAAGAGASSPPSAATSTVPVAGATEADEFDA